MEMNKLLQGISYEDYAAWGGIRASDLHTMRISMAHWKAKRDEPKPEKPSEALEFGRLFHLAMENGPRFLDKMVVEPKCDMRTNKGKEEKAAFYAGLTPDRIPIKQEWADQIAGMVKALARHSNIRRILNDGGVRESSLKVIDPETGLLIQCRPDFVPAANFCVDFKTTRSAHPSFFLGQIFSKKYDSDPYYCLAASHYAHCLKIAKLGGESFTIIAIEKEPPYGIVPYPLDQGCLEVGEQWRAKLMRDYAQCLRDEADAKKAGNEYHWPCYPEAFYPTQVPKYAKDIEEDGVWS